MFIANNLAPLAALLHPRPGYTPLLVSRNQDSAQYLTWIEGYKARWTVPNYHTPWATEPALRVPLMWIPAKISSFAHIPGVYSYLGLQIACYILAFYGLAFLLRVFTLTPRQAILAIGLMICALPLRSFALIPALLLKNESWALLHCGYDSFVAGDSSDGLFQGVSCSASITIGTAGALLCLALFGRYFCYHRQQDLWVASLITALSGFLHPFEFIPITAAAAFALGCEKGALRSRLSGLLIIGAPASAIVLFYVLPTLTHYWLKIATDLNRLHTVHIRGEDTLGFPVLLGVMFAFWQPNATSRADSFLACYIVVSVIGLHTTFLPWPQHFKDGLYYAASIFVVRKIEQMPGFRKFRSDLVCWGIGLFVVLIVGALLPHIYFRCLTYRIGKTATEFAQNSAVAPVDEVRAIAWLREHAMSCQLILAPREYAPWMATVPMHSFASHWLFSITYDQQAYLANKFFQGTLSDLESGSLVNHYGIRYVLVPVGSPALRYVRHAELRQTGPRLLLYEFSNSKMSKFPQLKKVSPGLYIWEPS